MDDLSRPLAGHPFLIGLDEAMVNVLTGCAKNTRFQPNEFLLREGDEASVFYLIRQGRVSLEVHIPGRDDVRVETAGPGDVVGLSWLLPLATGRVEAAPGASPGSARVHLDARALEPVVAFALDGACLRGKMEADHDLGYALAKRLLAQVYQRLERVRLQRLDVYKAL
jgi:CRP/FNR family transcriptional regulator, cyclic AMP receptor protein